MAQSYTLIAIGEIHRSIDRDRFDGLQVPVIPCFGAGTSVAMISVMKPTTETVECHHCNEPIPDRPNPPPDDDAAWAAEAAWHRFGCAAILSRAGARPSPVAPAWARGKEYRYGDPAWFTTPTRRY